MRKSILGIFIFVLLQISFLNFPNTAFAQTPGLIFKPAINGGNKVLDPNGDGYVSKSTAGFTGENMDEGSTYSEIPYKPFPVFMDEPLADLSTGAKYGHTDYAPRGIGSSPLASYSDGTNLLFRVRLGGESSASKGYSILIDANNTFDSTGKNPGFEYEIVLCTNFDVRIYYHGNNTNANPATDVVGPIIFSGSVDQYFQKSIASSKGGGDADYFYDFYVPISALNGAIVPVTSSTPLRMVGVTVTSAKSGLYGVVSDIGGVDDAKYKGNLIGAFKDLIGSYTSTAKAPVVNGPIIKVSGANTTINGYSVEAPGSEIIVYQNGVKIGTTTVLADGTWSLSVPETTLIVDRFITAQVKPVNKLLSDLSNAVKVQQTSCFSTSPPVITGVTSGNKGLTGTTSVTGLIKIYRVGSPAFIFSGNVTAGQQWVAEWGNNGGALESGTYYTSVTVNGCESASSNQLCYIAATGASAPSYMIDAPSISPSSITTSSSTIRVTGPIGSTLTLTKNGIQIGTATLGLSASTTSTVWTVNLTNLVNGDVLYARATTNSSICPTTSGRSNAVNVLIPATILRSTAPTITGDYCGTTTTLAGTSSEAPGTTIRIYGGTTVLGTTTVNAYGSWSINGLNLSAGSIITATATATGKTESASSTSKTINSSYIGALPAITTSPVTEGDTKLKGTAPSGAVITLYINGDPYVNAEGKPINVVTNSAGVWEYTNTSSPSTAISPFELYVGAKLTVTAKSSTTSTCESASSAEVQVKCKASNPQITTSLSQPVYCPGSSAIIKLSTSEIGIIYNIYIKTSSQTDDQATQFSTSILGNGKALDLTSYALSSTDQGKILFVKTVSTNSASCNYKIGGNFTISLYDAVPNNFTLTATPSNVCSNNTTVIKVTDALRNFTYQLIKLTSTTTYEKIGSPIVQTTDGVLNFPAVNVAAATDFSIIITSTNSGCSAENNQAKKVTVTTTGPIVNQLVTLSISAICIGGSVTFVFTGETGYTYTLTDATGKTFAGSSSIVVSNIVTLNSGILLTPGVFKFKIKVERSGSCITFLTTEPTVTVGNGPAEPVSAGSNKTICENTFNLEGSNPAPGTGIWSVTKKPAGLNSVPIIANPTLPNTAVTVPVSGIYEFTWTVTSVCGIIPSILNGLLPSIISSKVTITVNCPASVVVGSSKFYDEYIVGDVLATFSDDTDGGIVSYTTVSGNKPLGSDFSIVNGKLILKITSAPLVGGDFSFTVRTTDARGVTTDLPVFIRMYNRDRAPGGVVPFPVELMYLKIAVEKKKVVLRWETASEKDNEKFEIQRSADGITFYTIGMVHGNGTSNKAIKYNYIDTEPLSGTGYYRLKQIDFGGEITYSRLVSVKLSSFSEGLLHTVEAYPNPFTSELKVVAYAANPGTAKLVVMDMQGRIVYSSNFIMSAGANTHKLELPGNNRGVYILKVTGNSINSTTKLVKAE